MYMFGRIPSLSTLPPTPRDVMINLNGGVLSVTLSSSHPTDMGNGLALVGLSAFNQAGMTVHHHPYRHHGCPLNSVIVMCCGGVGDVIHVVMHSP